MTYSWELGRTTEAKAAFDMVEQSKTHTAQTTSQMQPFAKPRELGYKG
jgi:hypothetical protein